MHALSLQSDATSHAVARVAFGRDSRSPFDDCAGMRACSHAHCRTHHPAGRRGTHQTGRTRDHGARGGSKPGIRRRKPRAFRVGQSRRGRGRESSRRGSQSGCCC